MSFPEFVNPGALGLVGIGLDVAYRFLTVQNSTAPTPVQFDLGFPCNDGDLIVVDAGILFTDVALLAARTPTLAIGSQTRPIELQRVTEPSNNVTLWRAFTRAQAGDQFVTLLLPAVNQTIEGMFGAWRIPGIQEGPRTPQPLHGTGSPFKLHSFTDDGPGVAIAFAIGSGFNTQPEGPDAWRIIDYCSQGSIVGTGLAMELTGAGAIGEGDMLSGSQFGYATIVNPLYFVDHLIVGPGRGFTVTAGIVPAGAGPTEADRTAKPGADTLVPMPPSSEPDPPTTAHRSGQYPT